ncbi:Hypothetical protein FKW44_005289, partial [Caligus rogercresseyi]
MEAKRMNGSSHPRRPRHQRHRHTPNVCCRTVSNVRKRIKDAKTSRTSPDGPPRQLSTEVVQKAFTAIQAGNGHIGQEEERKQVHLVPAVKTRMHPSAVERPLLINVIKIFVWT